MEGKCNDFENLKLHAGKLRVKLTESQQIRYIKWVRNKMIFKIKFQFYLTHRKWENKRMSLNLCSRCLWKRVQEKYNKIYSLFITRMNLVCEQRLMDSTHNAGIMEKSPVMTFLKVLNLPWQFPYIIVPGFSSCQLMYQAGEAKPVTYIWPHKSPCLLYAFPKCEESHLLKLKIIIILYWID